MILTFQPPKIFFFILISGFILFFQSLITEFQINIFRERQNNQGAGRYRREHQWIIKHMPSVPLGKPPLGPNCGEAFLVLLDGSPHGVSQSDSDEDEERNCKPGPSPYPLKEQPLRKNISELPRKQAHLNSRADLQPTASLDWGGHDEPTPGLSKVKKATCISLLFLPTLSLPLLSLPLLLDMASPN